MSSISTPFRGGRINRRESLHVGTLGALGLALPQLLRAEATRNAAREMSCILIFPFGGPASRIYSISSRMPPPRSAASFSPLLLACQGSALPSTSRSWRGWPSSFLSSARSRIARPTMTLRPITC